MEVELGRRRRRQHVDHAADRVRAVERGRRAVDDLDPARLRQVDLVERVVVEEAGRAGRDAVLEEEIDRAGGERLADRRAVALAVGDGDRDARHLAHDLGRMRRLVELDGLGLDDADRGRRLDQTLFLAGGGDGDLLDDGVGARRLVVALFAVGWRGAGAAAATRAARRSIEAMPAPRQVREAGGLARAREGIMKPPGNETSSRPLAPHGARGLKDAQTGKDRGGGGSTAVGRSSGSADGEAGEHAHRIDARHRGRLRERGERRDRQQLVAMLVAAAHRALARRRRRGAVRAVLRRRLGSMLCAAVGGRMVRGSDAGPGW